MFYAIPARGAHLAVISYDIGNARRARRVRRQLDALRHAKQYSVYEVILRPDALDDLLVALAAESDGTEDALAAWRPRRDERWDCRDGVIRVAARMGQPLPAPQPPEPVGNAVLCYDIADPEALEAVASMVSSTCAMVQRSVYWLRAPMGELQQLVARCKPFVGANDRFWAYPLRGAHDLWRVGGQPSSLFPMAMDRWSPSR